jgi:hypothetical protein
VTGSGGTRGSGRPRVDGEAGWIGAGSARVSSVVASNLRLDDVAHAPSGVQSEPRRATCSRWARARCSRRPAGLAPKRREDCAPGSTTPRTSSPLGTTVPWMSARSTVAASAGGAGSSSSSTTTTTTKASAISRSTEPVVERPGPITGGVRRPRCHADAVGSLPRRRHGAPARACTVNLPLAVRQMDPSILPVSLPSPVEPG